MTAKAGPWTSPRAPWAGSDGGVDLPVTNHTFWNYVRTRAATSYRCPECGGACSRDEADVGIGIMYGPWGCACGWLEYEA